MVSHIWRVGEVWSTEACPACVAGYFSSRAAAKGFIRGATSYLQAARQLEVCHHRSAGSSHRQFAGHWQKALPEAIE